MTFGRIYAVPIALVIFLVGGFTITYVISVVLHHVRPIFPYISDTGTTPPESTIFSQVLNMGAVLIFITFYIRYKEVRSFYCDSALPHYSRVVLLNRFSLWLILPVAIGATMAANFQVTKAIVPHLLGAALCFFLGLVYFWLHTGISYLTSPTMCTKTMVRIRLLFVIISSVTSFSAGIFGLIAYASFRKTIQDMPKWGPEDGGYDIHLVSTISEWITLLVFGLYTLTFVKEFKDLALECPKLKKANCTAAQRGDYGSNGVNINSLDNIDRRQGENFNGNGATANLAVGGSKTLLV